MTLHILQACLLNHQLFCRFDFVIAEPDSGRGLIEILLEAGEDLADFFGVAEVGDGVGDGVVVLEAEQGG